MKTTPYTDLHIKLGAKMAEFAGYNRPIQYTTLSEEHNNVRNNVGVFDVSHMGEFRAKGPIAKHFMQYVTTKNVEDLFDGKVQYTFLTNGQGGVVDDMLVY
ncbi:MAG: glycine cleavage system aminomethyltransferase GcvT, partial [Bacteroidales bacterium]|nr:glycine cleavage system aminomethyltransferase GcvT [Bacteroidales bacterium]